MPKVGEPYFSEKCALGEYLTISSCKPHPSEAKNYGAKRTYMVHVVNSSWGAFFIGRCFSLHKARKMVLDY